jgi:hypothetical protein
VSPISVDPRIRHPIEPVPHELQRGCLSGTARSDETIQAVSELDRHTVEKPAGYREAFDGMMGHDFGGRRIIEGSSQDIERRQ